MSICNINCYADDLDINKTIFVSSIGEGYVVKEDGSLYRFPYDFNLMQAAEPIKMMDGVLSVSEDYVIKEDNTLWLWNTYDYTPKYVMEDVKNVYASETHALILKNDNSLWGIGKNSYGQLAQGTMSMSIEEQLLKDPYHIYAECTPSEYTTPVKIMEDIRSAAAGSGFSVFLKNDGSVYVCGLGMAGNLSDGRYTIINNNPVKILDNGIKVFAGKEAGFALTADNMLWRWGSNYFDLAGGIYYRRYTLPIEYISDVKQVVNMEGYNLVVKNNGELWAYGESEDEENIILTSTVTMVPCKLMDDVNCISGYDTGAFTGRVFALKNNGDLISMELKEGSNVVKKIFNNVRTEEFVPINTDYIDISDKPEEMQKSIKSLSKAGIIKGISDTEFSPDEGINRAETAALLLRMTGKENETAEPMFSDVTADDWYYSAAGVSQKYGILKGYEDNTFRGEEQVSKLQFVSLAARVLREESFKDITEYENKGSELNSVPDWASGDVQLALNSGLITEEDVRGNLDEGITRGEAAVILYRLYDRI